MIMKHSEKSLRVLLLAMGALLLPAWAAVFMPTSWMVWTHRWLGLGELPEAPIVEYLARDLSLFYGIHGGLLLLVARDVRRFLPVILYLGALGVVSGAIFFSVDFYAGMPASWTWSEGPIVVALGLVTLYLAKRVHDAQPTDGSAATAVRGPAPRKIPEDS